MDEFLDSDVEDKELSLLSFEENAACVLDGLSDELLAYTEAMQSVDTMSEPVRADAVAIAREILRKLKLKFGEVQTMEDLSVGTPEDVTDLDELGLVGQLLDHLLAWGRGIDASIMGDPSVQAAINALGQVAFIAKLESLRLAKLANAIFLNRAIRDRMQQVNAKFKAPSAKTFGALLETIERGMDRVLNRVQDLGVGGAGVSHATKELGGSFMNATPTAGLSQQQGAEASAAKSDAVGKKNMEILLAQDMAAQAQAAQIANQNAAKARQQGVTATPAGRTNTGRQALQQARAQRSSLTSTTNTTAPAMTPAQIARMNLMRLAMQQHHHDEDEHHHHPQQKPQASQLQWQIAHAAHDAAMLKAVTQKVAAQHYDATGQKLSDQAAKTAAAQKLAAKIDPAILKGFDMKGVTGAPVATGTEHLKHKLAQMTAAPAVAGTNPPLINGPQNPAHPQLPLPLPPHPTHNKGMGR